MRTKTNLFLFTHTHKRCLTSLFMQIYERKHGWERVWVNPLLYHFVGDFVIFVEKHVYLRSLKVRSTLFDTAFLTDETYFHCCMTLSRNENGCIDKICSYGMTWRTFPVITVIISMVCAPNYTMYLFIFILHLYLPYSTTLYCQTHTHTSGCRMSSLPDFANSAPSNMLVLGTLLLHIYFIRQIVKFVSHSLLQKIIAFCTWNVFVVVSGYVLYCSLYLHSILS